MQRPFAGMGKPISQDRCVPQLGGGPAARRRTPSALADGDERVSYRDLEEQANQLLTNLIALGVERKQLSASV